MHTDKHEQSMVIAAAVQSVPWYVEQLLMERIFLGLRCDSLVEHLLRPWMRQTALPVTLLNFLDVLQKFM